MARGSTPATRSASSAPSAVSTANARWTSTSIENIVASHTSPGATRCSTESASSANAKITIVTPANGSTWLTNTRLFHSIRRSFAATKRAIAQRAHVPPSRVVPAPESGGTCSWTRPAMMSTERRRQRTGPFEFVAGDQDRRPGRRGLAQRPRRVRHAPMRRGRRGVRRAATAALGVRSDRPVPFDASGPPTASDADVRRAVRPRRDVASPPASRHRRRPPSTPRTGRSRRR